MAELNKHDSKLEYLADFEADLLQQVDKLEDDLMNFEMSLQEALLKAVDKFKEKVQGNISDQRQRTITFIKFAAE